MPDNKNTDPAATNSIDPLERDKAVSSNTDATALVWLGILTNYSLYLLVHVMITRN
jgi:hypothetical protein